MRKFLKFFSTPFTESFSLFLSLTLLSSIVDVIAWITYGDPVFALYLGLHGYLMCYLLVLLYNAIKIRRIKKGYTVLLLFLGLISCLIDIVCHNTLHIGFTKDLVAIVMGTNPAESIEFVETFFTGSVFVVYAIVLFLIVMIYVKKDTINSLGYKFAYSLLFILFIGTGAICLKKSNNWEGVYLYKIITFLSYSASPDLNNYLQNPIVECVNDGPDNIVLIVGESFSKHHSSLYGYEKKTNPNLEKLRDDSLLFVYENIESAELGTILSFQCIMSTYRPEYKGRVNWYECLTLPEIVSKTDYKSIWISNQCRSGAYDNVVSRYAELCDTSIWTGAKFTGIVKTDLDELILEELKGRNEYISNKNFFVIHLMGSHYSFKARYPVNFDVFKAENYTEYPNHQRDELAAYDNSVLYNDYVVSEIFTLLGDEETLIIYFPDHGLDVYNSDENYVGHPRPSNEKSATVGKEIPFMIYTSPLYKAHFPEKIEKIEKTVNKHYRTDDVLYTVMDIIGVKFADNDDVNKFSLLYLN